MTAITSLSKEELVSLKEELQQQYDGFVAKNLSLDMSRGKPSGDHLDLSNGLLQELRDYKTKAGFDARNYGLLEGVPEVIEMFSELLDIPAGQIILGGNSSLSIMYDMISRCYTFGTGGNTPWGKLDKVKFLCPSPGYDRHFCVTEEFGVEMIPVPMTADGPDMDVVEKLVAEDEAIKGMWCVPLYSNPQGVCYSDEVVDRLVSMKTAAKDFRIMWDNAYGVHHVYEKVALKDILKAAKEAGNPDRVFYFFSTSKVTFPGAGVALMASSEANIAESKGRLFFQTIGPDKLNQLRTMQFFKNADGIRAHMDKLAANLRPKFDIVLATLEKELTGTGLATWVKPLGGYFVGVDTLDGCAKDTVALAKAAGVVLTGAGATFPYGKDPRDTNIRIAPTFPTEEELQQAMELFCLCVKLSGVNKLLGA